MAQHVINIGAAPNDGTGDPARTAFGNLNTDITELYASVASAATAAGTSFNPSGTGMSATQMQAAIAELKTMIDAINAILT